MLNILSRIAVFIVGLCAVSAYAQDTFPRLATISIGGPMNYEDSAVRANLAKVDFVVLSVWPGWEWGRSMNMEQVVRDLKARNPKIKVFLYIVTNENDVNNGAYAEVTRRIEETRGWVYKNGSSGTRVNSGFSPSHYLINSTPFSPRGSDGRNINEWYANWVVEKYYRTSPSIDGFFTDNVFVAPRIDGDWDRDGVIDSAKDPKVGRWLREGFREHFRTLQNLMPGKLQIGNIADWGNTAASNLDEFRGLVQGGVIEGLLGPSYSPERWGSWRTMMQWYRQTLAASSAPRLVMFHQEGDSTDYQSFRYGYASSLLDDGYYGFSDPARGGYHGVLWFDEYDLKLGRALAGPSLTPWKNGVFRRDFENGVALVNPRGNGDVEIDLEGDFQRIAGSQDRSVNSGALVRVVRLKDRDGIILRRVTAKPRPLPPAEVRVE